MDWSGCDLVEVVPGKVSGVPLVKGTRIPADFVIEISDRGAPVSEIKEDYPSLAEETILRLIRYAQEHRRVSVA